jgi:hypothetical protein
LLLPAKQYVLDKGIPFILNINGSIIFNSACQTIADPNAPAGSINVLANVMNVKCSGIDELSRNCCPAFTYQAYYWPLWFHTAMTLGTPASRNNQLYFVKQGKKETT